MECGSVLGAVVCSGRGAANSTRTAGFVFDPSLPPGSGVEALFVTHGHADHFRGAAGWRGRLYAPRLCRVFIEEPGLLHSLVTGGGHPVPEDIVTRYFIGPGARVSDEIDAPAKLPGGVEAVPAPGHTLGHVVYLVDAPGGRLLVAGDAVYGWSYLERSRIFFHVDTLSWRESLERLLELGFDAVVPGHGGPVEGSREARRLVEANIGMIDGMLGLVEEALPGPGEEPWSGDDVAAAVAALEGYSGSPRAYSVVSPSVRAVLYALERLGRAERLSRSGVPVWRRRRL